MMNTYNPHNPSEMLHLLVDGELESSLETPLYASLLENEELRSELRELIAIRESIRKDVEAYTPPVAATRGIFARLGYTAPVPPPVATTGTVGFLGLLRQKLWNPAVTAVVASVITALFFLNFSSNENSGSNPAYASAGNAGNNITALSPAIIPETVEQPEVLNKTETPAPVEIVYVTKYIDREVQQTSQVIEEEPVAETIIPVSDDVNQDLLSSVSPISFFSFDNVKLHPLQRSTGVAQDREFSLVNNYYQDNNKGHSLQLQIKGISGMSFPQVDVKDVNEKSLNNISFGAFTPLSDFIQFGLEAGWEQFNLSYFDIENNTVYNIQEEARPMLWVGMGIKMALQEQIEVLAYSQPFIHLTLASTQFGPLGKATTGLQFVNSNGVGIMLGIEGSWLVYQNDNRWYSSEKYGITYGMFMRF
ncbi:hypothetical protein ACFLSQ_07755 [Bacteroidota bacterium]